MQMYTFMQLDKYTISGCYSSMVHACVLSHVQFCNPMSCSPLDFSVHGILKARMKWVHALLKGSFPNPEIELASLHWWPLEGGRPGDGNHEDRAL